MVGLRVLQVLLSFKSDLLSSLGENWFKREVRRLKSEFLLVG